VTEAFDVVAFDHAGLDGGSEDTTCVSCHVSDDPHAGQFPGLGCAACHGIEAFVPVDARFDHDLTAFSLDGAHREVPCSSCHVAEQGEQGVFTRYKPVGTDCVDCHGGGS
jgi:hypothetical protein